MPSLTYTFVSRCAGGCHVTFDVQVNGGAAKRTTFDIDTLRAPLADITPEQRDDFIGRVLRVHIADKTRAQIATEFATPVTVTI